MNYMALGPHGTANLQATLSTSSSGNIGLPVPAPHHPITCSTTLRLEEDGTFACEHTEVPPGDIRTQQCLDHTIALLLIELSQLL